MDRETSFLYNQVKMSWKVFPAILILSSHRLTPKKIRLYLLPICTPMTEFLDINLTQKLTAFAPCLSQSLLLADLTENHTLL
jgi:hypothetical protein